MNLLTAKLMQYFISTFVIMLICIIALVQDKSPEGSAVFPGPKYKLPDAADDKSIKNSSSSVVILKASPKSLITGQQARIAMPDHLLTERSVFFIPDNPEIILAKPQTIVYTNAKKTAAPVHFFCLQCNPNFFAAKNSRYTLSSSVLQH